MKRNIGLVIGNIEDPFSNDLCKGAMKAAAETGDNLFIVPMKYVGEAEYNKADRNQLYEYQYNYLLNYAYSGCLDYVLFATGTVLANATDEEYAKMLSCVDGIPTMLLAERKEGFASICYDNKSGILEAIKYLATKKKCKKILMISGPLKNIDARERLEAYKQGLRENNLKFDESYVRYGNFSEHCESLVRDLYHYHPDVDAFVCANDAVAHTVFKEMQAVGRKVGKDIFLFGFDDLESDMLFDPPIASVHANAKSIGYTAFMESRKMLDSGTYEAKEILAETNLIFRGSVTGEYKKKTTFSHGEYEDSATRLNSMIDSLHAMNIANRDLLMYSSSSEDRYVDMIEALRFTTIGDCYLLIFDKPVVNERNQQAKLPDKILLKAYKQGDLVISPKSEEQNLNMAEAIRRYRYDHRGRSFVLIDLFYEEKQYGVLIAEMPHSFFPYVETACVQLCVSMKLQELLLEQEKLLAERSAMLERVRAENVELDKLSKFDPLTGLLNRRGFNEKFDEYTNDKRNLGRNVVILYCDLNYLKLINDRYTHQEGNYALKAVGEALKEVARNRGEASRAGGDEFVAFVEVSTSNPEEAERLAHAVKGYLDGTNRTSGKPYCVMSSVGTKMFKVEPGINLEKLIAGADEELYKDKANKGPFIER